MTDTTKSWVLAVFVMLYIALPFVLRGLSQRGYKTNVIIDMWTNAAILIAIGILAGVVYIRSWRKAVLACGLAVVISTSLLAFSMPYRLSSPSIVREFFVGSLKAFGITLIGLVAWFVLRRLSSEPDRGIPRAS